MTNTRTPVIALVITTIMLALSACNTTAGIGRDVASVGHATTDAAEDAKPSNR